MTVLWEKMKSYAEVHHIPILRDAELPLLCRLVTVSHPAAVLEIGTAIAYSTLRMASCLDGAVSITTIEVDEERIRAARRFIDSSPYGSSIRLLHGDAADLLDDLDGPWDFVFLDGPKGQYSRQLRRIMPKLSPGALIVADNMRYHDMIYTQGAVPHKHRTAIGRLREFLRMIYDDRKFDTVFFENGDGLTVSRWKG